MAGHLLVLEGLAGVLPAAYQGTLFRSTGDPIVDLKPPAGVTPDQQVRVFEAVLVALGDAWLEADRPRSAVEPLESAARLDAKSARAQLLLGTAYQSLGRKAEAPKAYRRYLELEPSSEYAKDVQVILANLGG